MDELCANPFVLKHKFSCLQWLKLIISGIFFLPIRIVVIVIFITLLIISSYTLYFIKEYIHRPKDYQKVRHNYLYVPMFFLKATTVAMGYWWVKVVDHSGKKGSNEDVGTIGTKPDHKNKLDNGRNKKSKSKLAELASKTIPRQLKPSVEAPILAVMPHQSIFDFLAILYLGLPVLVARYEGSHHWMLMALTKLFDPILVKRDSAQSRKETSDAIVKRASNDQVLLFPEGTDTTGHMIIKLRMGAFKPKLPVQLVVIKYNYDDDIDNVSWVHEGPSLGAQIFLSLCKLYTRVSVTKYNIYFPNEVDKKDPIKYSEHFHKYACSTTKYSYYVFGDSKLLLLCTECNLPRSPASCKLIHLAVKVFLSQVQSSLPKGHADEVVSYISSQASQESGKTDEETKSVDGSKNNETKSVDGSKNSKCSKDETSIEINGINQLFDKKQLSICAEFVEMSKKKGKELPSNDHIKKWIDKPEGYELRKAIHETLANIVREAKFDSHPPESTITKQLLIDILNLSHKYDSVINSTVVRDLLQTLTLDFTIKITVIELRAFMSLCHTQIKSLWERIELWFRLLGRVRGTTSVGDISSFHEISLTHFKLLVWYLIGLEPSLFIDDMFVGQRITLRFVKENFVNLFRRAVEENSDPLLTEKGISEDSIEYN